MNTSIITILFVISFAMTPVIGQASNHYTKKQIDALASRVGQTFWIEAANGKPPEFYSTASPNGSKFSPAANDSFEILELAGRSTKIPWYRVKFSNGKEAFIRPLVFLEQLNLTILTIDPMAEEKLESQQAAADDKERVKWINAQPWAAAVKDAAIKRQPVPGMNTGEIKRVIGEPNRMIKNQRAQKINGVAEERWYYPDGTILTFHNGLLIKSERKED